ncbi:Ig-like domain-containing protein [Paenibacillus oralis]|nr:Ig-like domain-containing protein [Paenibacillus oralis]
MARKKRKLEKVDHILKVTLLTSQVINLTNPFYANANGLTEQDQIHYADPDNAVTVTDSTYDVGPQTYYIMADDPLELLQMLPYGSGVSLTPLLSLLFDQEPSLGTGEIAVYRESDNRMVDRLSGGNVRLSGNMAIISLNSPLVDDTSYYVEVTSGMFLDGAGQGFGGIRGPWTWSFRTMDQTAPQLVDKSPEGSGASLSPWLNMTFSEPVKWGTGDVIIHEAADGSVAGQARVSGGMVTDSYGNLNGNEAELYLYNWGLESGTSYYVEVTPGTLVDRSGNPFSGVLGSSEWTFTTRDEAPYYTDLWPQSGGAELQPQLTIRFSEAIHLGTGEIAVYRQLDNQMVDRLSGGNVRLSGNMAIISLNSPLVDDTSYYVEVTSGMFLDGAGQGFGGIRGPWTWSFRTMDQTAPQLVDKSPEGSGASLSPWLNMTFSEPVKWGTGDVIIHETADGSVAGQARVSGGMVTDGYGYLNESTAQLNLQQRLESGTSYYVEVTPGTLVDRSGNPFAGVLGSSEWTFTTRDEAPYYTDLWPQSGGSELQPQLTIRFSEAIHLGTGEIAVYRQLDNQMVDRLSGGNVRLSGNMAIISLNSPLVDDTSYYVEVTSGMFLDGAGQGFGGIRGPWAWNFRTMDQTAPQLVDKSPQGSGASLSPWLNMTFSEPVKWGTGDVIIHEAADGSVAGQAHVSGGMVTNGYGNLNGNEAELYLYNWGLESGTSYYVEVTPGTLVDRSGNPFAGVLGSSEWTFTTRDEAPYYTDLWPQSGGSELQPQLTIRFSEAIHLGTGEIAVYRQLDNQMVDRLSGGNVRLSGNMAIISLNSPLVDDTSYYVEVTSGMFLDGAGQGFGGIRGPWMWSFRTMDQTAPQLVDKSPEGSGASLSPWLNMTFSEPVKWGTGDVIIHEAADGSVAGQARVSGGMVTDGGYGYLNGNEAELYLYNWGLESGTSYYVEVTSGTLVDRSGNPFAGVLGSSEWTFTTRDEAPYYTDLWPQSGGSELQPQLTIRFSEAIHLGTGEIAVYRQSDNQMVDRLSGGNVRLSGNMAIISLNSPLVDDTSYYVEVTSGMFLDGAGQGFGGIRGPWMWSFRTMDQTAPQLVDKSPEGSGASLSPWLNMTFSEPVKWGTGDVIIHETADGSVAGQARVSGGMVTDGYGYLNESTVQLNLQQRLESGTSYYVEVTPGTLVDRSGNPFTGVLGSSKWVFKTISSTPNVTPQKSRKSAVTSLTTRDSVSPVSPQDGIMAYAQIMDGATEAGEQTTINIYAETLSSELQKNGAVHDGPQVLMIDAAGYGSNIIFNLPLEAFRNAGPLENLRIGFGSSNAQYLLPADLIQQWSNTYDEDSLSVQIMKLDEKTGSLIQGIVLDEGAVQAEPGPIDFSIRIGDVEVSDFSKEYVERKILLNQPVPADRSTAVWMNPETNRVSFVPSLFQDKNGATEVSIKTDHNSIYTVLSNDKSFADMNSHWARNDVELMANKLLLHGAAPNKFEPNRAITRAEFVVLVVRGLGLKEEPKSDLFLDVSANDWFTGSIGAALIAGLVQGDGNNFNPNTPITREEMAVIAQKAIEYVEGSEIKTDPEARTPVFKDEETVSPWAKNAMKQALNQGLIHGINQDTIAPKQKSSRAEAASFVKRLLKYLKFID